MAYVRIALCQTNTVSGNPRANLTSVLDQLSQASSAGAQLAVFPEMTLSGYPPRDLLEYHGFLADIAEMQQPIREATQRLGILALIGQPLPNPFGGKKPLINSAVLYGTGADSDPWVSKKLLPTYDVFDEHRYFEPAPADHQSGLMEVTLQDGTSIRLGVTICEDIWNDDEFWKSDRLYPVDPAAQLAKAGAQILINLSASPFVQGKPQRRLEMLRHTARRWGLPVAQVNQVGGNDQVVFDGGSVLLDPTGEVLASAGWFQDGVTVASLDAKPREVRPPDDLEAMEQALRMGLKDYLDKTGFRRVVLGNSGGIDSALVLSLCAAELGADRVVSVSMPGPFTSVETRKDSAELAQRWGIRHLEIPITPAFQVTIDLLGTDQSTGVPQFFQSLGTTPSRVAQENLQSRLRGMTLMWLSNALGDLPTLVVTTGNKSELATGYCTLYGDMCGGLALISDVPKMAVYALARRINQTFGDKIPLSIIDREPSAELAPNQRDSDSLPPYPVLDEIVRLHVEERMDADEIARTGVCNEATAQRMVMLIARNEYKRQQAAPGIKVTSKAFGVGRRMPIARG